MNEPLVRTAGATPVKDGVVDCDIHPLPARPDDVLAYMPERWQEHHRVYGSHFRAPFRESSPWPRAAPAISRRDAWPPNGNVPGSDLPFMREQHLDLHNIEFGILQVLGFATGSQRNLDYSAAIASALNQWQLDYWCNPEPRLKGSIVIPTEDPEAAVAEIERWAGHPAFAQIFMTPRLTEPMGRRRYWPIYEAASRHNLPIGIHGGGHGAHATTGGGWPSYYIEEHPTAGQSAQALITSLIVEGVLERWTNLRFVVVEAGFAWVPALGWRLDKHWRRLRSEVPHIERLPSEQMHQHFWFTTQPVDEPERPDDMRRTFDWIGWDRILYASDYPHWDFDDPRYAFPFRLSPEERAMLFRDNAVSLFGLA